VLAEVEFARNLAIAQAFGDQRVLPGLSLALLDAMGAGLCVLTSDVPENREVVDGAGFTFQRGNATDLADRLRFLLANPAVREAASRTAKRRIEERCQWQNIAQEIEKTYFQLMRWGLSGLPAKKSNASVAAIVETVRPEQRAG
jgi:glycosyltransferase involved in cell wall biosynthesis